MNYTARQQARLNAFAHRLVLSYNAATAGVTRTDFAKYTGLGLSSVASFCADPTTPFIARRSRVIVVTMNGDADEWIYRHPLSEDGRALLLSVLTRVALGRMQ